MLFSDLSAKVLYPLEQTKKKLEQTEILARVFGEAEVSDLADITHFVLGRLGPVYANPELNMGLELFLLACGRAASGAPVTTTLFGEVESDLQVDRQTKTVLKRRFKELGDAGKLAQELPINPPPTLTVEAVMDQLRQISQSSGEGSQERKIELLAQLFTQLGELDRRFVARFVVGDTRLGVSDRTILDAVSWMLAGDKSLRERIEDVYQRHPDLAGLVQSARVGGVEAVELVGAELGVPVLPALCDRLKTTQEMIDKMGEVFVEPKYDGTRIQIHWDASTRTLRTFTRNLEENTGMFPELPGLLEQLDVESVILDCEAVGYNPETNELVTFQQTIKRKRKHNIEEFSTSIPLRFFVFDILFLNGESIIKTPLENRKEQLTTLLKNAPSDLLLSPQIRTTSAEEIHLYHNQQLAAGLEGIIVKQVQSPYQSGRKAFTWVKLKEAEGTTAKLSDTIDAVILGYYFGRGKRTDFGVGAFLVGVLDDSDPTERKVLTIAKIGTGLNDLQWRELKERCDALRAQEVGGSTIQPVIPDGLMPDVLVPVEPKGLVTEIAADEITRSPLHSAQLALRFPRLVQFRDDKSVEQATTLSELRQIAGEV